MDNMLTVALVVLISSIIVFFSKEFGDLFKKIFAIGGMKLLLPLLLATVLVVNFEYWVYLGLTSVQDFLTELTKKMANWMPFHRGGSSLAKILLLMGFPFLPVIAINFWVKRKSYHSFKYASVTLAILWLTFVLLLTIEYR